MLLKQIQRGSLLILAIGLTACGGGGSAVTTAAVSGKVTQGPVIGATIFADRLGAGTARVKDDGELSTTTDASGNFNLSVPSNYGDYVLVSQGGTDSLTGKPAIQMMAPAGSANVTPLTTMVSLAPANQQAALKAKIEATGIKFDDDISTHATAAALFLSKSIEAAIETLGVGIANTGTVLSASQLNDVQYKSMSAIAAAFASEPDLLNSANLVDGIKNGVGNADFSSDGITSTSPVALAQSVSNCVNDIARIMGNPTGNFDASTATTEADKLTAQILNSISDSIVVNSNNAASKITGHPILVLTSFHFTGININSTVSLAFSEDMDPATLTASTFKINGVSGTVSYNSATKTATFHPAAPFAYNTTYTITVTPDIKDLQGRTLIVPAALALTFTTVLQPTTGSTGTSGTGANF